MPIDLWHGVRLLRQATIRATRTATRRLAPYRLTVSEFDILEQLSHTPDGLSADQIADALAPLLPHSILRGLCIRGLITQAALPPGVAVAPIRFTLTEEGAQAHRLAERPYRDAMRPLHEFLGGIPPTPAD